MAHSSPGSVPHHRWGDSPPNDHYHFQPHYGDMSRVNAGQRMHRPNDQPMRAASSTSDLEAARNETLRQQHCNTEQTQNTGHRNFLPQLPSLRQVLGPISHPPMSIQSPYPSQWSGDSSVYTRSSQHSPSPSLTFERTSQRSPLSEVFTTPTTPSHTPGDVTIKDLLSNSTHNTPMPLSHQMQSPGSPMDMSTPFRDPPRSDPFGHSRDPSSHSFTSEHHSPHDSIQTQHTLANLTLLRGKPGEVATSGEPLPHFVHEQNVPGEGPCYFYDDGSHCKTVIDGEQVNPHWGVTKAGKPRKRLAIACLTCREKKIKCDPEFTDSKCVQCEKFGRICRFKTTYVLSPSDPLMEQSAGHSYRTACAFF